MWEFYLEGFGGRRKVKPTVSGCVMSAKCFPYKLDINKEKRTHLQALRVALTIQHSNDYSFAVFNHMRDLDSAY